MKWKNFSPQGGGAGKKDLPLPIEVHVVSTMNEGEEIECINRIFWKLGKDVPDEVFVDPKEKPIVEPTFEGAEANWSRS